MSKFGDDITEALDQAESWITEVRNRAKPVVAEVEKYGDPFIKALNDGLAAAGITVPVRYVDVALSLVSKLADLDKSAADVPAEPGAPADPVLAPAQ
jgi:hypothetical protein